MQKQVAFWLALCCRPKLLILDEPLDGLDPVMRKQIWTILMSEVAERRTTVLVSSHNLRELEDVCDHVGIMNHGKVIIERSLFDLHGNISKIQVACQTGMPKLPKEFEILHMSNSGRVYTMIVKGNPRRLRQPSRQRETIWLLWTFCRLHWKKFLFMKWEVWAMKSKTSFLTVRFLKKCDPVLADLGMLSVIWDGKSAGAAVVASAATDGHDCLCQGLCIVQQSASGSGCGRNCNYGSRLWDGFVWLSVYPEECVYDPCTAGYKGELYVTNMISGLCFLLIPQALVFLVTVVLCLLKGIASVQFLGLWFLSVMGIAFSFMQRCVFVSCLPDSCLHFRCTFWRLTM